MPLSINNNISALKALGIKQGVIANNITNSGSQGFKASTTVLEAGITGAVAAKLQPVNTPGVKINRPDGSLEELSNVDLGRELTEIIPTQRGYEANLKALQASAEMEDRTLDLIG